MIGKQRLCPLAVARQHSRGDRPVLGVDVPVILGEGAGKTPIALRLHEKLPAQLQPPAVGAGRGDFVVKALMVAVPRVRLRTAGIGHGVAELRELVRHGKHPALPRQIAIRDGRFQARQFDRDARLCQIDEILARDQGDGKTALRLGRHQPLRREPCKRLPHGAETGVEFFLERVDTQLLAGAETRGDDRVAQPLIGARRHALVDGDVVHIVEGLHGPTLSQSDKGENVFFVDACFLLT